MLAFATASPLTDRRLYSFRSFVKCLVRSTKCFCSRDNAGQRPDRAFLQFAIMRNRGADQTAVFSTFQLHFPISIARQHCPFRTSTPRQGTMMPHGRSTLDYFSLLIPLAFLCPLTSSIPATSAIRPLVFVSNSSLYQPNIIRTHCLASPSWTLPHYDTVHDCVDAIDRLYFTDSGRYKSRPFEFVAANTAPSSRSLDVQYTPRRYTIGSCTIAVVMLVDFPTSEPLPGEPPGRHPPRDVATFEQVWESARRIYVGCIHTENSAGWEVIGRDEQTGVFIWSSGSEVDRAVGGNP